MKEISVNYPGHLLTEPMLDRMGPPVYNTQISNSGYVMNTRIYTAFNILFFLLLTVTVQAESILTEPEAEPAPAGIVKTLTGTAYIYRGDTRIRVNPDMTVLEKDLFVTKRNTHAGIVFTDGTVITIGPESMFEMTAFIFKPEAHQYDFSFYMEKGTAIYNSGEIGRRSPQSVKMKTPKATIGIRGTRFVVDL